MAKIDEISGNLFDEKYNVIIRIVMCHDIVHRKNKGFAKQALKKSGFAELVVSILPYFSNASRDEILGNVSIQDNDVDTFCNSFLETNCKCFTNYHDDKLCTVEFTTKFMSNIRALKTVPSELLEQLHLEILTPVGSVQL